MRQQQCDPLPRCDRVNICVGGVPSPPLPPLHWTLITGDQLNTKCHFAVEVQGRYEHCILHTYCHTSKILPNGYKIFYVTSLKPDITNNYKLYITVWNPHHGLVFQFVITVMGVGWYTITLLAKFGTMNRLIMICNFVPSSCFWRANTKWSRVNRDICKPLSLIDCLIMPPPGLRAAATTWQTRVMTRSGGQQLQFWCLYI